MTTRKTTTTTAKMLTYEQKEKKDEEDSRDEGQEQITELENLRTLDEKKKTESWPHVLKLFLKVSLNGRRACAAQEKQIPLGRFAFSGFSSLDAPAETLEEGFLLW